jgi:mannose-1-phosphate guanylyltransferase
MRALLLAAGVGSRLRPLTESVPKCLVPIRGRPLLDYWLGLLFAEGAVARALINTHHLASQVEAHVSRSPWRDRIDLVREDRLLGTGGTLKANRAYFGDESFLVAHADNLTDFDVAAFQAAHAARPPGCAITMLTFETDDPRSCGIVELDRDGVVRAFHEKVARPPGRLANAAVYLFTPEAADFTARLPGPAVDLSTQVIPAFLGRIYAVRHAGFHRDIGTRDSLARACADYPAPSGAE